jgi:hypothetical protein
MSKSFHLCALLALTALLPACDGTSAFTLYRSGISKPELGVNMDDVRSHVATFDADESEAYNRENCETASKLFQSQPGVTVRYWCEKGRYHK